MFLILVFVLLSSSLFRLGLCYLIRVVWLCSGNGSSSEVNGFLCVFPLLDTHYHIWIHFVLRFGSEQINDRLKKIPRSQRHFARFFDGHVHFKSSSSFSFIQEKSMFRFLTGAFSKNRKRRHKNFKQLLSEAKIWNIFFFEDLTFIPFSLKALSLLRLLLPLHRKEIKVG